MERLLYCYKVSCKLVHDSGAVEEITALLTAETKRKLKDLPKNHKILKTIIYQLGTLDFKKLISPCQPVS